MPWEIIEEEQQKGHKEIATMDIKLIDKTSPMLAYIAGEICRPGIRNFLFDDQTTHENVLSLLESSEIWVYGIFEDGQLAPVGAAWCENLRPAGIVSFFETFFDPANRQEKFVEANGDESSIAEKIKADIVKKFNPSLLVTGTMGNDKDSMSVLEKLGFKLVSIDKNGIFAGGKLQDFVVFHLYLKE